jgi:copper resistance protein C
MGTERAISEGRRTGSRATWWRRTATGVLAAGVALVVAPGAAHAHGDLVGSSPSAGSTITQAPADVRLEFAEDVVARGTVVTVTDADGRDLVSGPLTLEYTRVTAPVAGLTESGVYTVTYRAVYVDGEDAEGDFSFTVDLQGSSSQEGVGSGAPVWLVAVSVVVVLALGGLLWRTRRTGRS